MKNAAFAFCCMLRLGAKLLAHEPETPALDAWDQHRAPKTAVTGGGAAGPRMSGRIPGLTWEILVETH